MSKEVVIMPDVAIQLVGVVTFAPRVPGGVGPYTYAFDYGDGVKGASLSHVYAKTGTYFVHVAVTDGAGEHGNGACTVTVSSMPPSTPTTGASSKT